MCNENVIRRVAGSFLLLSLVLATTVSQNWLFFTAFIGVNLLQSSFTGFCPIERVFGRLHLFGCTPRAVPPAATVPVREVPR